MNPGISLWKQITHNTRSSAVSVIVDHTVYDARIATDCWQK